MKLRHLSAIVLGVAVAILLHYLAWLAERNTDNWTILTAFLMIGLGLAGVTANLIAALRTGWRLGLAIFLFSLYAAAVIAPLFLWN